MKKAIWLAQTGAFYLFTLLVALLPASLTLPAGRLVGALMWHALPKRRRIALENISLSFPFMTASPLWDSTFTTPEEVARATFRNIGTSLVEVCRLYHGKGDDLMAAFRVEGMEHYLAARQRGTGIIFLTGHCGNWELGALAYGRLFKLPMWVVARRQNNPYLNRMVEKMRMRYDNRIIYKDNAMRGMLQVIRSNGLIGLLADQAAFSDNGSLIPFLGRYAWATKGPVVITRKTGVALLPVFIHRAGDSHVLTILPECVLGGEAGDEGIAADVRTYSSFIEEFIIRHPADWYWVHRRWKRAGEMVA